MKNKEQAYLNYLKELNAQNGSRILRTIKMAGNGKVWWDGKIYLNLSSNDYLGLASHEVLNNLFHEMLREGFSENRILPGAVSSRLLTGNHPGYDLLELKLADLYNSEASLFFNSGYHANISVLRAVSDKRDLILSDAYNHASIIDGMRLSDAETVIFRHLDLEHLEQILDKRRRDYNRVFIVSESIFSMDGDAVNLSEMVRIKNKYDSFLYLDEAHAIGTRGENGLGICEELGYIHDVDFIIGTFGKALASQGAFLICSELMKNFLINTARSLIYSTALPPISILWNLLIANKMTGFNNEREMLRSLTAKMQTALEQYGLKNSSQSNIIPIIIGENHRAEKIAKLLQERGILVFPIRPPTVPHGTSRLRLSLTANLSWEDISAIPELISEFLREPVGH